MSFDKDKPYKWILLPIETKIREFHAKVLLACVAAEAGFCVVLWTLGDSKKQKWRSLPRGICLEKSIVKANAKKFALLRKFGNKVCAWCEEGLVLLSRQEYQQRRVCPESVGQVEYFFAWGDYQADAIVEKVPSAKELIRVYGNPRIDILRPEFRSIFDDDVEALRERYGDFILVNTNFSLCNHVKGTEAVIKIFKKSGKISNKEQESFYHNWIEYKNKLHQEFVLMVQAVSRSYPDLTIIIRPHPSEDFESWKQVTADLDNVRVIHQGNVIPWLRAARVVVHNGCTTGLEGYLLGSSVIAYQPVTSPEFDFYLPNIVSRKATSTENIIETIELIFSEGAHALVDDNKNNHAIVDSYLKGLEGALASEQIVEILKQVDVTPQPFAQPLSMRLLLGLNTLWLAGKYHLRDIKDRLVIVSAKKEDGSSQTLHNMQKKYAEQKFPGMSLDEVKETISKLQNASGRFNSVDVVEIDKNSFVIGAWK
jgi:surface carbohydrate biosynthesis protein